MGHKVGWLTLYAGVAGGADIILLPEIPYDLDKVIAAIAKRNHDQNQDDDNCNDCRYKILFHIKSSFLLGCTLRSSNAPDFAIDFLSAALNFHRRMHRVRQCR